MALRLAKTMMLAALLGVAAASAVANAADLARPVRVVSLNLCTDQLLLGLADPAQIAAVSFLAQDPALSPLAEMARGLPINRGRLEEVVALRPDLVIAGRYGAQQTVSRLRQLGVDVLELDIAQDFDAALAQIGILAEALGQAPRGREMAAQIGARMAALRAAQPTRRPIAAILDANGLSLGADTLADAVLALAGFDNAASRLGRHGLTRLGLEQALVSDAQLLILNDSEVGWPSLGQALLDHPALARRFDADKRIAVPRKLWICGGPAALDAAELLAAARMRLARRP